MEQITMQLPVELQNVITETVKNALDVAIKDALKDGSLSKQGRLKWKKTLADIEKAQ